MRTSKYLDKLMKKNGLKRDRELAIYLGISAPSIAQYRSGNRTMDNEMCIKIAMELGVEPIKIIMASDLDRAERSGQKSLWEVFISRTQTVKNTGVSAALCLVFVTNLLTGAEAKATPVLNIEKNQLTNFILCQIVNF
jgi:transcriptional regulator with XRE-family HTH domain